MRLYPLELVYYCGIEDMFRRILEQKIKNQLHKGKAIIIYGPRRVGKTTLVKKIAGEMGEYIYLNCDEPDVRAALTDKNSFELKGLIGKNKIVVIDEAQRVHNIGITIKLIIDNNLTEDLIVTGSSSLDLANSINEPLTGRKIVFTLSPLLYKEITDDLSSLERKRVLNNLYIYGAYPEIVNTSSINEKITLLKELVDSSLYKDILEFQRIRNPHKLRDLLKLLAYQVGGEVSYNDIGQQLGMDRQTVENYINLLEQSFILYRLPPLTQNSRKEISRLKKIYFYDLGIRNALINQFESFDIRPDKGNIWENFCINERIKLHRTTRDSRNHYFWRLKSGAEIDLVEDLGSSIQAFEFKSSKKSRPAPKKWLEIYPKSSWEVINPYNFDELGLN